MLSCIAQSLSLNTVLSPIASIYHISALTPHANAQFIHTPILIPTLHYKHTLHHARTRATTNIPTANLTTKDDAQFLLLEHPELVNVTTVNKDQLAVWPRSYWEGSTGVMNNTYHQEVCLLISPALLCGTT
jgi:hypothetical protein